MKYLIFTTFALSLSGLVSCALLNPSRRSSRPKMSSNYAVKSGALGTDDLRKRIFILPFLDHKASRSKRVVNVARQAVVRQLARTGHLVIVDNGDLPKNPSSFLTKEKQYDLEEVGRVAATMGVAAVFEGKIMEIKARRTADAMGVFRKVRAKVEAKIRVRIISSKNGRLIMDEIRTAELEAETTKVGQYQFSDRYLEEDPILVRKAVVRAFRGTIKKIIIGLEKISWEGRVARVSGERVFVNAGRLTGIQIGDILKVTEAGEEIYDPENGRFLGSAPGRMKGTVEVVSYFGHDGTIAIVHSGAGFLENDFVQLY